MTAATMTAGGLMLAGATPASADTIDYPPDRVVKPGPSGVNSAVGLAARADGTLYVADGGPGFDRIWIIKRTATGHRPSARAIQGANAGLDEVVDVGLDARGQVYAATADGRVSVFGAGAFGNVAPIRVFATGGPATGMAVSSAGEVAIGRAAGDEVVVFAPGSIGTPAPTRTIKGPKTGLEEGLQELEYDGTGRLWVLADGNLLGFAAAATGDVAPANKARPLRTGRFEFAKADDLAVDHRNRLFLSFSHEESETKAYSSVAAYPAGAQGEVDPLRVLEGTRSRLETIDAATALTVDRRGDVAVTGHPRSDVLVFRTFFPVRPTAVRSVTVSGKPRAVKRTVRWKQPADDGGRDVRSYKLVFRKGSKTLKTVALKPGRRSYKVAKSALRRGSLTVTVRAKTAKGWSPKVVKRFRVR
ncbi:hypothetical protein [Mumia sp. DW29H23]|uniref:hypothetical protein n=1 Tax=Mumia sp. DW29H23 TaxID=3421241 RepID=UPI003D6808F6